MRRIALKAGVLVLVNRCFDFTEWRASVLSDLTCSGPKGRVNPCPKAWLHLHTAVFWLKSHMAVRIELPLCNLYKEKSTSLKKRKKGSVFARLKVVQYWWMGTKQRSKKVTSLTSSQSAHCYAEELKQKVEITAPVFYCEATLSLWFQNLSLLKL